MCGRYDNLIAREAYRSMYKAMRVPASNRLPRYNIAPPDQVPIVRVDPARRGAREDDGGNPAVGHSFYQLQTAQTESFLTG
jgi:putative SOS response-associated peptidase YedK